jgi:hypothetical protein
MKGRPPVTNSTRRTERVTTRFNPLELIAISSVAEELKMSFSALLREAVLRNKYVQPKLAELKRIKKGVK